MNSVQNGERFLFIILLENLRVRQCTARVRKFESSWPLLCDGPPPALSPGERVADSPPGEQPTLFRLSTARDSLFPRPGGEGQGGNETVAPRKANVGNAVIPEGRWPVRD